MKKLLLGMIFILSSHSFAIEKIGCKGNENSWKNVYIETGAVKAKSNNFTNGSKLVGLKNGETSIRDMEGNLYTCEGCPQGQHGCELTAELSSIYVYRGMIRPEAHPVQTDKKAVLVYLKCSACEFDNCAKDEAADEYAQALELIQNYDSK